MWETWIIMGLYQGKISSPGGDAHSCNLVNTYHADHFFLHGKRAPNLITLCHLGCSHRFHCARTQQSKLLHAW